MNIIKKLLRDPLFFRYTLILLTVEFVRGAVLISLLPIYGAETLLLPLWAIGLAVTVHYMSDTVIKIFSGYLLDRFSFRIIMNIGLLIALISICMLYFFPIPWLIIVVCAFYGIGISPVWLACLSLVKQNERGTQMGVLYTVWLAALGSGPVIMNFLLDVHDEAAFYLIIGLSLVSLLLSFGVDRVRTGAVQRLSLGKQWAVLWRYMRNIKILLPGMILQTLGASMLVPVLPEFARKVLGLSPTQYSFILIAGGLCAVLGLIPMGRLSDVHGKKWFLVIGFSLFAVGLYSLAYSTEIVMIVVWAALLGLSYSAVLPSWNALLSYYVPPQQEGMGWGVLSTVEGIGVMLGPVLGGVFASSINETFPIIVSSLLFLTIGIFYFVYPIGGAFMSGRKK